MGTRNRITSCVCSVCDVEVDEGQSNPRFCDKHKRSFSIVISTGPECTIVAGVDMPEYDSDNDDWVIDLGGDTYNMMAFWRLVMPGEPAGAWWMHDQHGSKVGVALGAALDMIN